MNKANGPKSVLILRMTVFAFAIGIPQSSVLSWGTAQAAVAQNSDNVQQGAKPESLPGCDPETCSEIYEFGQIAAMGSNSQWQDFCSEMYSLMSESSSLELRLQAGPMSASCRAISSQSYQTKINFLYNFID